MTDRARRVETLAPWATGLLLAAPVLLAFYPPMTDLPFHEAAIGVLRHFDDAAMFPPGLYVRNLGQPNQLFHLVGWALSYGMSTRWAVKLLVAAAVVAVPVSAARFARYAGASPLASIVVSPMALGWLFSWGLIANLIGLGAFLFSLPVLDRFAQRPARGRAVAACGALVLLYFAHEAMMFLYVGIALALAILHPWSWRGTIARLTPFVAGVTVTVATTLWQKPLTGPVVSSVPVTWASLGHKLAQAPYIVFPAREGFVQLLISALCVFAVGSFFWMRGRERRAQGQAISSRMPFVERTRAWALAYRWELFAAACLGAYLVFPATLHGATLVYHRWFPPGFAMLAVVAAPRDLWTKSARAPLFGLAALPLATLLVAFPSFVDSDWQYRMLDRLLPQIEPGSSVVELNLGPGDPSRGYSLGPASGRALATRGGRLAFAFTISPISPAVMPRRYQWNETLARVGYDCLDFRPAHDLTRFRYVIVRTTDPALTKLSTWALGPETEYIDEAGDWTLFRSRLAVVPLLSRDAPLEKPAPESLRDRFRALLGQIPGAPDFDRTAEGPSPPEAERVHPLDAP